MPSETSEDKINQIIIEGITVSAATAIERARQHKIPLVVWADEQIIEISPSTLSSESGKLRQ